VKLLHLANHGSRNVGNGALILGLERVLREDFRTEPSFAAEPWDDYSIGRRRFDESFVERVNRDCDALLVGAAVTFDGRPPYAATGMRFDLPVELWPRLRKPVVFYGLSHRGWGNRSNYRHLDALRRTLETILASERMLFSVRNDGTKQWLADVTGVESDRVREVPDPAVFVPVENTSHVELDPDRVNVVLALNDEIATTFKEERPEHAARERVLRALRRPTRWEARTSNVHGEIVSGLRTLARERELNVLLCPHDPSDVWATADFVRQVPGAERSMLSFAAAGVAVRRTPLFYDLYAKCDLAIALRVHSMNPAVGIGAPVVPVLSQRRMRVFMSDAGLESLCADVDQPGLGDAIVERSRAALADPDAVRAALEAARVRLRERTAAFNRTVEEFVTG
jgi:Polysaccharide pyruvyl transferase